MQKYTKILLKLSTQNPLHSNPRLYSLSYQASNSGKVIKDDKANTKHVLINPLS